MKLYIDDRFLSFIYEDKREEPLVKDHFTYADYSKVYMRGKFDKNKIANVCFVQKKKEKYNFLYSGFLQELLILCKKEKVKITEVKDNRTRFPFQKKDFTDLEIKKVLPEFEYVEHQVDVLKKLLRINAGIVKAPTSSGKTEVMIALLKIAKLPALILVNRISLALQTVDRLKKNGITNVGICYGKGRTDGDIVVSTIGSIKKIPSFEKFKILLVDESHRANANQFQTFLRSTSIPIRFGFSATPEGNDIYKYAKVRQFLGSIVFDIDPNVLIKKKVIALPKIHFVKVKGRPTLDWPSANNNCIVDNAERNDKIRELVEKYDTPTLILVRMIEHGEILSSLIDDSVFLSGIDDVDVRRQTIQQFEDREIKTIIATSIFDEGISINAIRLLVIASGGKSKILSIQRLGRSLRLDDGKEEVLVYDFEDQLNKFTERHSQIRKRTYQKAGFKYLVE